MSNEWRPFVGSKRAQRLQEAALANACIKGTVIKAPLDVPKSSPHQSVPRRNSTVPTQEQHVLIPKDPGVQKSGPATAEAKPTYFSSAPSKKAGNIDTIFIRQTQIQQAKLGAPPGMTNHGNTCYLNATLQVLFNLDFFAKGFQQTDLLTLMAKAGRVQHQHQHQPLQDRDQNGVRDMGSEAPPLKLSRSTGSSSTLIFDAMTRVHGDYCKAAASNTKTSRGVPTLSPKAIQAAMAATAAPNMPQWAGFRQQDAHELLVALLDRLQSEVLAAQDLLRPCTSCHVMPVSHVLCPGARSFSGCLQHTLTCSKCSHVTQVKEQISHLSLQLPSGPHLGRSIKIQALIADYFQEEEVEKSCEACGLSSVPHKVQHRVRRLPPVLVVHLKRFKHEVLEGGECRYSKLHTLIDLGAGDIRLGAHCMPNSIPGDTSSQPATGQEVPYPGFSVAGGKGTVASGVAVLPTERAATPDSSWGGSGNDSDLRDDSVPSCGSKRGHSRAFTWEATHPGGAASAAKGNTLTLLSLPGLPSLLPAPGDPAAVGRAPLSAADLLRYSPSSGIGGVGGKSSGESTSVGGGTPGFPLAALAVAGPSAGPSGKRCHGLAGGTGGPNPFSRFQGMKTSALAARDGSASRGAAAGGPSASSLSASPRPPATSGYPSPAAPALPRPATASERLSAIPRSQFFSESEAGGPASLLPFRRSLAPLGSPRAGSTSVHKPREEASMRPAGPRGREDEEEEEELLQRVLAESLKDCQAAAERTQAPQRPEISSGHREQPVGQDPGRVDGREVRAAAPFVAAAAGTGLHVAAPIAILEDDFDADVMRAIRMSLEGEWLPEPLTGPGVGEDRAGDGLQLPLAELGGSEGRERTPPRKQGGANEEAPSFSFRGKAGSRDLMLQGTAIKQGSRTQVTPTAVGEGRRAEMTPTALPFLQGPASPDVLDLSSPIVEDNQMEEAMQLSMVNFESEQRLREDEAVQQCMSNGLSKRHHSGTALSLSMVRARRGDLSMSHPERDPILDNEAPWSLRRSREAKPCELFKSIGDEDVAPGEERQRDPDSGAQGGRQLIQDLETSGDAGKYPSLPPLARVLLVEDSDMEEDDRERVGRAAKERSAAACSASAQASVCSATFNVDLAPDLDKENARPHGAGDVEPDPRWTSGQNTSRRQGVTETIGNLPVKYGSVAGVAAAGQALAHAATYRLQGAVLHRGMTPFCGHYVAEVRCGQEWFLFNDEHVEPTQASVVLQEVAQDGYVLFFPQAALLSPKNVQ